ncbi:aldehyde dehydrogenase [Holotrichia oblita]|nr:aldehyde dehydrogenase [Holotrichia oblita]
MRAASENLTPVTLELGGKSPCIVDKTANIDLSAKRIVWGKFINAGQTCVAPDYILVQKSVKERLIEALKKYIVKFYGEKPLENANLPKIINVKHFERLLGLMKNQEIAAGGTADSEKNKIEPTILNNVPLKSPVMQEEIFGPILPVIEYDTLNDVVKLVNARPKPLALYFFTSDKETEKFILKNISFGGGCINDTIVHLATSYMPFGGVGDSGMGSYHGKSGFDTFSHRKSILKKSRHIDIPIRYPSEKDRTGLLKLFMK